MSAEAQLIQKIEEFCEKAEGSERPGLEFNGSFLNFGDLRMLLAVAKGVASEPRAQAAQAFLADAERATVGWRRANQRQVQHIDRLLAQIQDIRLLVNGRDDDLAVAVREILDR